MKAKISLLVGIVIGVIATTSVLLLQKGTIQQAKAATFVSSGEEWIDDLARYDNRQMWLALKSSDYKMVLTETRALPEQRTIRQTLQYQADPKSDDVLALKKLFKKRFCAGFLASEMREAGLTKTLLFTDTDGRTLNSATLSEAKCAQYR